MGPLLQDFQFRGPRGGWREDNRGHSPPIDLAAGKHLIPPALADRLLHLLEFQNFVGQLVRRNGRRALALQLLAYQALAAGDATQDSNERDSFRGHASTTA